MSSRVKKSASSKPVPDPGSVIVRAAIHPAIGIARVGNSLNEFYIGPEVTEPIPAPPGFYKDGTGALKREACRFRVYGYNAAGEVVAELTAKNATVQWSAHLANKKASWYEFQLALDIPEAASAPPSQRRNANIQGADRANLAIDPGSRTIQGSNVSGKKYAFDTGKFMGKPVYLGELRTDEAGRLIVLGGRGASGSYDCSIATDFANSDAWHDDVSDGPVTATVTVSGKSIPVDPAWVIVAPPNYGPELRTVRTMWDLMSDMFMSNGWIPRIQQVSFKEHVLPIFQRMCELQWVNQGFAEQFGWGGRNYFLEPEYLAQLSSKSTDMQELRRQVYNSFRNYDRDSYAPMPWPWIYGDAMNVPAAKTPRQNLQISPTQLQILSKWAAGNFIDDYDSSFTPPRSIDEVPLQAQPVTLDKAAMEYCLADAFHPGCEMTWPVRNLSMYMSAFRFRHRPAQDPEPDYGPVLTPEIAMSAAGPLGAQGPGDITRWMAVPWQTDTASCRSGYESTYDPYVPTFWPARVPNRVLSLDAYHKVLNEELPREERLSAFKMRSLWLRGLKGTYIHQVNQMVTDFGKLGVIERRPGVKDDPEFPPVMLVESLPGFVVEKGVLLKAGAGEADASKGPFNGELINKVQRFKV